MQDTLSAHKHKIEITKILLIEGLDRHGVVSDMDELAERDGVSLYDLARARTQLGLTAVFGDDGQWRWYRSENEPKRPPKKEWHWPHLVEVFYPQTIRSTQDRHNWIKGAMLDTRTGHDRKGRPFQLNDRDKLVMTRLAFHLNLKTGRPLDLLAAELSFSENEDSARRMVRRSLERAELMGWLKRIGRHAGGRLNRSNVYQLTIPKDIRPDKSDRSSGQIEHVVRTPQSGRIGNVNREREYSLLSEEHRLRDAHTKVQNLTIQKDGTSDEGSDFQKINSPNPRMSPEPEWVGYTMGEVEQIRDLISCYGVNTIASIVACAREFPLHHRQCNWEDVPRRTLSPGRRLRLPTG